MSPSSKRVVYAAIIANLAIMICKYVAAFFTRSSAMLAEAFHSSADTLNEFLLLIGMKRSERPADELHPFGHGKELYFWSLIVAVFIFGVGGGFSIYDGILRIVHLTLSGPAKWNYIVLAVSVMFEGYSWVISRRVMMSRKRAQESLWHYIRRSKDPTVFTVFLEDSVALAGIAIAFVGIFLSELLHNPYLDPAASILIGLLLAAVAIVLAKESGALLLGESANPERTAHIKDIILAHQKVDAVGDIFTMQLGPEQVLLNVDIRFKPGMTTEEIESTIDRIECEIREKEPFIKRIFIEVDSLRRRSKQFLPVN